ARRQPRPPYSGGFATDVIGGAACNGGEGCITSLVQSEVVHLDCCGSQRPSDRPRADVQNRRIAAISTPCCDSQRTNWDTLPHGRGTTRPSGGRPFNRAVGEYPTSGCATRRRRVVRVTNSRAEPG